MSNNIHDILHRLSALEGGARRSRPVTESEVPALCRPRQQNEGYRVVRDIDRERYTDLSDEGLEGPFQTNDGRVVYYDPQAGKYYDRDSDRYLDHDEVDMTESAELSEARLEEKASEDMLSKVKASFTDYLKGLEDEIKNDREILDRKKKDLDLTKKSLKDLELQAPEAVTEYEETEELDMPPPVKRFTLECGTACDIYGNDTDGYVVRRGARELPTRFNSLDDADMALQLFNARRSAPVQSTGSADYLEEK